MTSNDEIPAREKLDSIETRISQLQPGDKILCVFDSEIKTHKFLAPMTVNRVVDERLYGDMTDNQLLQRNKDLVLSGASINVRDVVLPYRFEIPPFEEITGKDLKFGDLVLLENMPGLWVSMRIHNARSHEQGMVFMGLLSSSDHRTALLTTLVDSSKSIFLVERFESKENVESIEKDIDLLENSGLLKKTASFFESIMFKEKEGQTWAETGEQWDFYIEDIIFEAILAEDDISTDIVSTIKNIKKLNSSLRKTFYSILGRKPTEIVQSFRLSKDAEQNLLRFEAFREEWPDEYSSFKNKFAKEIKKSWDITSFWY